MSRSIPNPEAVERVDSAELRALLEKATPGLRTASVRRIRDILEAGIGATRDGDGLKANYDDDAALIVSAIKKLPALLADRDKLETENERKGKMLTACEATIAREREWRLSAEASNASLIGALRVIANASERCETMFGGKMSEVTRVFEHITRVSRQALADLPLSPVEPDSALDNADLIDLDEVFPPAPVESGLAGADNNREGVETVRCSRCGNPDIQMCDCGLPSNTRSPVGGEGCPEACCEHCRRFGCSAPAPVPLGDVGGLVTEETREAIAEMLRGSWRESCRELGDRIIGRILSALADKSEGAAADDSHER